MLDAEPNKALKPYSFNQYMYKYSILRWAYYVKTRSTISILAPTVPTDFFTYHHKSRRYIPIIFSLLQYLRQPRCLSPPLRPAPACRPTRPRTPPSSRPCRPVIETGGHSLLLRFFLLPCLTITMAVDQD